MQADLMEIYAFSELYKITNDKKKECESALRYADALKRPLLEINLEEISSTIPEAVAVLDANLDKLFMACESLGIPRIFIGRHELVGADEIRISSGWQPAIWRLKEILSGGRHSSDGNGYSAGCGNADQSQTNDASNFLPEQVLNKAWDVNTRKQIDVTPFTARMVVSKGMFETNEI